MFGYNNNYFNTTFLNSLNKAINESLTKAQNRSGIGLPANQIMERNDAEKVADPYRTSGESVVATPQTPKYTYMGRGPDQLSDLQLQNLMREKKRTSIFEKEPKQSEEYLYLKGESDRREAVKRERAGAAERMATAQSRGMLDRRTSTQAEPKFTTPSEPTTPLLTPNLSTSGVDLAKSTSLPAPESKAGRLPSQQITTSGRQTGVGSGKTLMQPDETWDEVARKDAAKSRAFAGQDLSNVKFERRDDGVYANGIRLTNASEKVKSYARNAPTRAEINASEAPVAPTTGGGSKEYFTFEKVRNDLKFDPAKAVPRYPNLPSF